MSVNIERAGYGRDAMLAGTPDHSQNELVNNAIDTIANVLHAVHGNQGRDMPVFSQINDVIDMARERFEDGVLDSRLNGKGSA